MLLCSEETRLKNRYTIILTIIIFIFGFALGVIVNENGDLFIINNVRVTHF